MMKRRFTMLNKLKQKNEELLQKYKNQNDDKNLTIQNLIHELLSTQDCFLKMSIEQAYAIFKQLDIKESAFKDIYIELTKSKN